MRSAVHAQFRERSEPSKGNAIRNAGITDRFQGEQAIKRWQRGEMDEIDRRMLEAVEQLREERDEEREQDQRDRNDLKAKHQQLSDEARREMGIPEPKVREPEPVNERDRIAEEISAVGYRDDPDIETDRYGKEIIDMSGPVEPEEVPPLEPVGYVPDRDIPPPEYNFEMGD